MLGMFTGQSGLLEVKCRTLQIAKKQEKQEKKEKKKVYVPKRRISSQD